MALETWESVALHRWGHTSVVEFGDGSESLLPRRVPNLKPNDGRGIDIDDALRQERCAYGRLRRGRRECVLYVAVHKGRLAYALAAEHDNLRFKTVRHGGSSAVAMISILAVVLYCSVVLWASAADVYVFA